MAGGGVHATCSRFQGDMVAQDDQRIPFIERMPAALVFQVPGFEIGQDTVIGDAEDRHAGLHQVPSQDQDLPVTGFDGRIVEIRMKGHGQVGRQGPGSGSPDHHGNLPPGQLRGNIRRIVLQRKFNVHRGRGLIVVFNFGLGKGGLAAAAPVDRLLAAKQAAVQGELAALSGDGRLVAVVHGQVGIVPLAHDTEALELVSLDVDELLGVSPTTAANLGLCHLLFFGPELLVHIVFDGQTMAVPTRNVGGVEAGHLPGTDDDVL